MKKKCKCKRCKEKGNPYQNQTDKKWYFREEDEVGYVGPFDTKSKAQAVLDFYGADSLEIPMKFSIVKVAQIWNVKIVGAFVGFNESFSGYGSTIPNAISNLISQMKKRC